ncbi:hypothetical protein DPMN_163521 [Dreissena polymorpha]|uniref:Uncharacterized protein n=1 Tax=Dreissena polymorpha TaxID=45954 RepID=A0A9D4ETF7_DREPO|nr:hypothetical protein DPMN_163521 [Dreissena polymorpha]
MTMEEPCVVTMRTGVGCPEVKVTVAMYDVHIPYQRQQIIEVNGLSRNRQEYLYKVFRPYLSDANKDVTCPCPETYL